jgi:hypothetical protein
MLRFDVTERLWSNMYLMKDEKAAKRLVKDYRLEFFANGKWETLAEERDNYLRFRQHKTNVCTDKIRLVVLAVRGGCQAARVYEIRVY